MKSLTTIEQHRLNALLAKRINFGENGGILTWDEAIKSIFDRKFISLVPSVKYVHHKYVHMDKGEKKEYEKKLNIKKSVYYFGYKNSEWYIEVPKMLYEYTQNLTELPTEEIGWE